MLCYAATVLVIPNASAYLLRRGLKGKDLGKRDTPAGELEMCVCGECAARRATDSCVCV